MGKYIFSALFSVFLLASPAQAQQDYTVTVTGEAVASVVPDKARVALTVQAEAKTQADAVNQQALNSQQLMRLLRQSGVSDKDVSTAGYSYGPVYDFVKNEQKLRGYKATQSLVVSTPRDKGSVLVDAVSSVAKVDSVSFFVSNVKELHELLVDSAINDARTRASLRASQLGLSLGPIVGYSESPNRLNVRESAAAALSRSAAPAGAGATPEFGAGESEVHASVTVTYKILVH